ncbi:MAG: DNA polymerase III subunit chi [Xanthomonadales bacterium]|nr:DNA polymerase III subunit chi [Xanthomonadales bacterium]
MAEHCQVDFYLLGSPALDAERLACRLALMAWERGHRISIVSRDKAQCQQLDELMWQSPEGRFLPHETGDQHPAPVRLLLAPPEDEADVVINLTESPMPLPMAWKRLLEIVPHRPAEREASREKFRHYRAGGLDPKAHDIN